MTSRSSSGSGSNRKSKSAGSAGVSPNNVNTMVARVKNLNKRGRLNKDRQLRVISNKFYKMVLKRNVSNLTKKQKMELEKKIYKVFKIIHNATKRTYVKQIKSVYREAVRYSRKGAFFSLKKLMILGLKTMLLPASSLLSGSTNLVYHGKVLAPSTYMQIGGGTVLGIAEVAYGLKMGKMMKAYSSQPITLNATETREFFSTVNTNVPTMEVIDFLSSSASYGKAILSEVAAQVETITPNEVKVGLEITSGAVSTIGRTTKNKTLKAIGDATTSAASSYAGAVYTSAKEKLLGSKKRSSPLRIAGK